MGLLSYHLKSERFRVAQLLFAYAVLWMKGAKAIHAISVAIANNSVIKDQMFELIHSMITHCISLGYMLHFYILMGVATFSLKLHETIFGDLLVCLNNAKN